MQSNQIVFNRLLWREICCGLETSFDPGRRNIFSVLFRPLPSWLLYPCSKTDEIHFFSQRADTTKVSGACSNSPPDVFQTFRKIVTKIQIQFMLKFFPFCHENSPCFGVNETKGYQLYLISIF